MSFEAFEFHPDVAAGVRAFGYTTPTPIQAKAIPTVMKGLDVLGLAQTGTGKTAAFALPILHRLMKGPRHRLRTLVVAPTRELAEQIHQSFCDLGRQTGLRSTAIYGGVGVNPQIDRLRSGVEIAVACPGRLLDHAARGTIDLSHVETVVLDEADQMFDMGFLPDVRRILKLLPRNRQTLLFSATMPPDIRHLSREVLTDPATVQVDRVAPASTVSHALYPVPQHLKTPLLLELMTRSDTESVLVFTRTKHRAKRIGEQLEKAGYKAASIQGNLSQRRRQAALEGFRSGSYQVLVATDIAARGIDVAGVSHVINYDMPNTVEAYTHRIGRTGRAAETGDAFTFVTGEDEGLVRAIERTLGSKIERRRVAGFDYKVAAPRRDTEFARAPRPPRGKGRSSTGQQKRRPGKPAARKTVEIQGDASSASSTANPQPRRFRPRRPR